MPGYNVEGPAAAFSNSLEDYLTRQRREAMAQQELNQRMHEMGLRAQIEQQNLEMRKQELADRTQQRDYTKFAEQTQSMQPNDIPGADYVAQARKLGFGHLVPEPTPQQLEPGEQGPMPPQAVRFTGLPKQREEERQRQAGETLLQGMDPASAEYKALQYELTTNRNAPAGMFRGPITQENVPIFRVGPTGAPEKIGEAPKGSTIIRQDQAPTDAALTLSEAGTDMAARHYAMTGQLPPMGMGKDAKTVREAIINRAAQYDVNTGQFNATTPPNITQNKAQVGANQAALTQLQRNSDAVSAFANTARDNKKLFDQVLTQIPDTGVTWGNWLVRGGATMFGSESMAQFNALRQSLSNEYARIISNPNLVGVMSDRARQEMQTVLDPNAPVGAIKAALDALVAESDNRDREFKSQIQEVQKRLGPASAPTGGGGASKSPLDQPASGLPADWWQMHGGR